MLANLLTALVMVAAAAAPSTPSPAALSPPVVVTPALEVARGLSIAQALVAPFSDTFTVSDPSGSSAPRAVHNCRDYLALGRRRLDTGSTLNDQTLLVIGTRCVALDWIAAVRPEPHRLIPPFSLRRLRARQLPPQLELTISREEQDAVREASRRGESLLAIDSDVILHRETVDTARLSAGSWVEDLTLYAYGDFLGGGSEQIIVQTNSDVVGGTYRASHLYLLIRKPKGWVVVRSYPDET